MNVKKRYLALLLAASLSATMLAGCGGGEAPVEETPVDTAKVTAVEVQKVTRGSISNLTQLSGKIVPNREVPVMPLLAGKVQSVSVKVGDTVQQGQVLFTLDREDIEKKYRPIQNNYQRTVTLSEESLRQARENVENMEQLYEVGAISRTALDQAKLALLQQETNTATQLEQLDVNIEDIDDTLKDTSVKAPVTGVITEVNVVENNTASNAAAAMMIAENHIPQVQVEVAETLIPYIKVGNQVEVVIPAVGNDAISLTVRSISPLTSSKTQLYEVKMDIPANQGYKVGMFANVTFRTNNRSDVIVVPSEAILTDGEIYYAFTEKDGIATKVIVEQGITSGELTEVTSGLSGGENLIVKGQNYVSDGGKVAVTNQEGAASASDTNAGSKPEDAQQAEAKE